MASRNPFVINIRGTVEYSQFLDRLLGIVQKTHPEIRSFNQLAVLGIQRLAKRHGLESPPTAGPRGRPRKQGESA